MGHGGGELIFVGTHQREAFAFADEPSGKGRDHPDGQVHRPGQMPRRIGQRLADIDEMIDLEFAQFRQ